MNSFCTGRKAGVLSKGLVRPYDSCRPDCSAHAAALDIGGDIVLIAEHVAMGPARQHEMGDLPPQITSKAVVRVRRVHTRTL